MDKFRDNWSGRSCIDANPTQYNAHIFRVISAYMTTRGEHSQHVWNHLELGIEADLCALLGGVTRATRLSSARCIKCFAASLGVTAFSGPAFSALPFGPSRLFWKHAPVTLLLFTILYLIFIYPWANKDVCLLTRLARKRHSCTFLYWIRDRQAVARGRRAQDRRTDGRTDRRKATLKSFTAAWRSGKYATRIRFFVLSSSSPGCYR